MPTCLELFSTAGDVKYNVRDPGFEGLHGKVLCIRSTWSRSAFLPREAGVIALNTQRDVNTPSSRLTSFGRSLLSKTWLALRDSTQAGSSWPPQMPARLGVTYGRWSFTGKETEAQRTETTYLRMTARKQQSPS